MKGAITGIISISTVTDVLKITSSAGAGTEPEDQLATLFQLLIDGPIHVIEAA